MVSYVEYREQPNIIFRSVERDRNTIGCMDIVLPSSFTGGQVTVSCGSNQIILDTSTNSQFGTSFICMYSGLFQKMHPVSSGCRIVLTYQLQLASSSESSTLLKNPAMLAGSPHLSKMFDEWNIRLKDRETTPDFLTHILSYRYSEMSLSFKNLKGQDATKVVGLKQIAEDLGFVIYLGLCEVVTIQDEDQKNDPASHSVCEEYRIKYAVDSSGSKIDASFLSLSKDQLMPPFDIAMWDYFEGKYEDFTFNEGCDDAYCKY